MEDEIMVMTKRDTIGWPMDATFVGVWNGKGGGSVWRLTAMVCNNDGSSSMEVN